MIREGSRSSSEPHTKLICLERAESYLLFFLYARKRDVQWDMLGYWYCLWSSVKKMRKTTICCGATLV